MLTLGTKIALQVLGRKSWCENIDTLAPCSQVRLTSNQKEVAALAEELTQCVTMLEPDELWIPMGLGHHVDHRLTRSACLRMLADARGRLS
jgi:hypothetical protein